MVGFLVEYTIHNDKYGSIRDILENILLLRIENYIRIGTTLYYRQNLDILKYVEKNNNIFINCMIEKYILKHEIKRILRNINYNNVYIKLQVFAIVGRSN